MSNKILFRFLKLEFLKVLRLQIGILPWVIISKELLTVSSSIGVILQVHFESSEDA